MEFRIPQPRQPVTVGQALDSRICRLHGIETRVSRDSRPRVCQIVPSPVTRVLVTDSIAPESAKYLVRRQVALVGPGCSAPSADRAADMLPNFAFPAMDGGGAMEIFVSTSEGVCDFISAMDTARIPEWNTWYHLLNCGYPLKLSGETDFPCMSSRRVGQGRVYVQLGDVKDVNFVDWCAGIAAGRAYVSDGYAHATAFTVDGKAAGAEDVALAVPGSVVVTTTVAFAAEQPRAVAYGTLLPPTGKRTVGDTVNLHAPRDTGFVEGGERLIEVIVNGQVAASQNVPADGKPHDLKFEIPIGQSSWIAVRQFPQLHTNPVNVIVDGKPIRASRGSGLWCAESVRLLWKNRNRFIAESERPAARDAYERSLKQFLTRAGEATDDPDLVVSETALQ